jgi:site-specific DNA-methyltransferase (adenine-specific)
VEDLLKPYYEDSSCTIYHGDSFALLPEVWFGVDLLLTDPPYAIDACNMTLGIGKRDFVRGDWDGERPDIRPLLTFPHLCIWGGNYFSDVLAPTNDWLIWHKKNDGRSFSECEMAWTNYGCNTRMLSHHWGGEPKQHPTQKPLSVVAWALAKCPVRPSLVLDTFMGSGTTLRACKDANVRAIGIEREEAYCEIAAKRLSQEVLALA